MTTKKVLILIPYEDISEELSVKRKVIYPVEPAIVVSILKQNNIKVQGIDLNKDYKNEKQIFDFLKISLKKLNPDIVLIMSSHLTFLIKEQYEVNVKLIQLIKEYKKTIKIILSGTNPTAFPEKYFKNKYIPDILFRGEIENQILNIINNINDSEILYNIIGVCYKNQISGKINYIEDLDVLPIADRNIFDYKDYFNYPEIGNLRYPEKSRKFTHISVTRGCNTNCSFCKVKYLRKKYRWRSIENIINEIKFLLNKGIEEIIFLDENLLLNKVKAKKLFRKIISEKLKFYWFGGCGLPLYMLDKELLELMKESGCYKLPLAVESGTQRILTDIMNKPVDLKKHVPLIEYAKKIGFEIIGYFMIGLPTETKNEILETVKLAENKMFDYVVFSIYTPEKGTDLYEYCLENNLLKNNEIGNLSKRAESNLKFPDFDNTFLVEIRNEKWKEINFEDENRKKKLSKMFGVNYE